jgi:hypothetical protein
MDKNIIKKYLSETFLSEAKKNETKSSPGIKLAGKMANDNKKINKDGVAAVGKDMKDIEKSSQKMDANSKTMATNKFNYEGKKEEDYHDQMEIMNGQEMIQYDRTPNKQFKDRAEEAIEGSTRMGNNPEWANVVAKGQGGDPEFGKKLVKSIKASEKKRAEQTRTTKMFGNDWEVIDDSSHKSYAFEGRTGKNTLKEDEDYERASREVQYGINPHNEPEDMKNFQDTLYDRIAGVGPEDIKDCNGYGYIVDLIKDGRDVALELCVEITHEYWEPYEKETNDSPAHGGGLSELEIKASRGKMTVYGNEIEDNQEIELTPEMLDTINSDDSIMNEIHNDLFEKYSKKEFDIDPEMSRSAYNKLKRNFPRNVNENINKKQTQIKETMKRLKFKKEFNGVGNALKLIPESYKVNDKVFEMTDGNETYKIRWEGSLTEGKAVILKAADSKMVNEDIEKMKHLFNYKSHETFGILKGKDRLDENTKFSDIWNKTKALLKEEEEEDEAPIKKRKDAYDASLDVDDPEDIEKSTSKLDIEKSTKEPAIISKDVTGDDEEDDMEIPDEDGTELKLAKSTKTGQFAILSKIGNKIVSDLPISDELADSIKSGKITIRMALEKTKAEKETEMSDDELMEALNKMMDLDDK